MLKHPIFHYRQIPRPILIFGAVACLVVVAAGLLYAGSSGAQSSSGRWVKVTRPQFQQPLVLQGIVAPGKTIDILASADGTIVKIHAKAGDIVTKGQRLLEIDASETRNQLHEAEAEMIRGEQEARTLDGSSNSELHAALRRHAIQRNLAAQSDQRVIETRALFEQGVVSRSELESVENEQRSAHDQVISTEEEIAAIRKKFSPEMGRAAKLELLVKRHKRDSLKKKLSQLVVVAPASGVLLPPPAESGQSGANKDFRQGSPVNGRDVLYSLGELGTTLVRMSVNEMDVGKLQVGQAAKIRVMTLPDTSLDGTVEYVSVLAKRNSADGGRFGGGGGTEFDALVRIKDELFAAPENSGGKVYFGASAEVSVEREFDEEAFELPVNAIGWDNENRPFVWVREKIDARKSRGLIDRFAWAWEKRNARKLRSSINIAEMTADRVIARSGVNEDDEVWVEGAPAEEPESDPSRPLEWLRDLFKFTDDEE